MPLAPSPFSSVPGFLNRGATPPVMQGPPMGGAPGAGGPPGSQVPGLMSGGSDGGSDLDLFQRVSLLLMDPQTKQLNPAAVLLFAGMGLREALEKSGKFVSKPHRSNDELSQQGVPVGMPGQTGMPSPDKMVRQLRPPSVPGAM